MTYSSPQIGLLGQILDTEIDPQELAQCTPCEMASMIQTKALSAILVAELDPNLAVEIDGEKWDRNRAIQGLRDLYDWASTLCANTDAEKAGAIITVVPKCNPRGNCK